ncbi:hypothetical protein CRV00_02705 [Malaciobacter molluscorum]|uniref:response regulator n=1 Tax=Malaciobacter molluscorum TaxID=1032072 RepID=UPI00100BBEE2|nr:response regulator [Malaciobacter molluscorum]RXJ96112.1 hypothetical protein CRV00_02705 [Malaciobacter molluscorum]
MLKKRILLVEDESLIAKELKYALDLNEFNVVKITKSHNETMQVLQKTNIELILMDINIQGQIDGIQSCDIIYYKYKIPIIFMSGHSDNETLELIKQSKALGYILKPFKYEQLYMQIYFVFNKKTNKQINFSTKKVNLKNEFTYCLDKKILYWQNREIKLTKKERKMLYILCKNINNYVSYENLFSQVWEDEQFNLNKIRGSIFRIKRKIPALRIFNNKENGYSIQ